MSLLLILLGLGGCTVQPQPEPPLSGGDSDADADSDSDVDADTDADTDTGTGIGEDCGAPEAEPAALETDDGLTLAADFHTVAAANAPAAILFHMHPPSGFTRQDWHPDFIEALLAEGMHVLNVDRRGAGGSEGDPADAPGPDGWLDAKAAVDFVISHACAVDPTRIALVGASNGTTTALDFAIQAGASDDLADPAALVFFTGGDYTEGQNAIDDHRGLLDTIPIQFIYQPAESAWSLGFQDGAPDVWEFVEVEGGHGTEIFGIDPTVVPTVVDFLAGHLGS